MCSISWVLGFKLRSSCLLCKCFTNCACPLPVLFVFLFCHLLLEPVLVVLEWDLYLLLCSFQCAYLICICFALFSQSSHCPLPPKVLLHANHQLPLPAPQSLVIMVLGLYCVLCFDGLPVCWIYMVSLLLVSHAAALLLCAFVWSQPARIAGQLVDTVIHRVGL